MRTYRYVNLKTRVVHTLSVDDNDPPSMELQSENRTELLAGEDVAKLPVYGKIAAGVPIQMNEELGEIFYFPKQWHRGAQYFVLKVAGDSMENAGIKAGDYVVVRQQQTADNLDIVVVALGDEATVKRFSRMGSSVILLSDNPKYDPIMLKEEKVSVLGMVVGTIHANL